jgi:hypothetical protein
MTRRRGGPSQGWRTFLSNYADGIVSMDLFVVPTLSFRLLYGLLILRHHRRQILWLGVTANPTAEWIAQQLTEAYGWEAAPDYIVRDRDCAYGKAFIRRLRAMAPAGYPKGLAVKLTTEHFLEIPEYAVILQNAAKKIGVHIDLSIEAQMAYYGKAVYGQSRRSRATVFGTQRISRTRSMTASSRNMWRQWICSRSAPPPARSSACSSTRAL